MFFVWIASGLCRTTNFEKKSKAFLMFFNIFDQMWNICWGKFAWRSYDEKYLHRVLALHQIQKKFMCFFFISKLFTKRIICSLIWTSKILFDKHDTIFSNLETLWNNKMFVNLIFFIFAYMQKKKNNKRRLQSSVHICCTKKFVQMIIYSVRIRTSFPWEVKEKKMQLFSLDNFWKLIFSLNPKNICTQRKKKTLEKQNNNATHKRSFHLFNICLWNFVFFFLCDFAFSKKKK